MYSYLSEVLLGSGYMEIRCEVSRDFATGIH